MRKRYYTIDRSYFVAGLGWLTLPEGFKVTAHSVIYVHPSWCNGV